MARTLVRGLTNQAQKIFCLKYDPFFRGPLTRHHFREGLIDVRNDMIEEIDNVYDQMLNTDDSKTVLLSGRRGTGKTSALIYLQNRLFDLIETEYMKHMGEKRELDREITKDLILPFYVNVIGRRENITDEILRDDIHRSIFDTMINTLNRLDKLFPHAEIPKRINEITTREQGRELHKPREIEGSIGNLVELVAEYFTRFCVILDDADKYSPDDYPIIEDYFNHTQAFYEMLMGKKLGKQTVGFILIPTQIVMGKHMAHQVSFLGDIEINFNKWRNNEIIQLIEKRFRKAHMKNPLINVTEIIESKVINELYSKNNANPRFIQVALQQLMNKAAENVLDPDNLNISLSHNICQGKISYAFVKKNSNLLIGGTYKIQLDGEEDLQSLVKREYSEVYNELLDIVWERPEEGGDIIETICEIKQRGLSDNISSLRILMDRGFIMESEIKGRAGLHKEYDFEKVSLSEQMDKLVTVLYKELKEWTEVISLLYYMCI